MVSRKPFYLLVALLFIVGLGMTFYHHVALDVPLTPGEKRQIWSIEAKLEFEATGEPVIASLAIPGTQPGFTLMNENAASPGYGLSFVEKMAMPAPSGPSAPPPAVRSSTTAST